MYIIYLLFYLLIAWFVAAFVVLVLGIGFFIVYLLMGIKTYKKRSGIIK